jgi:S-adenosylmethionine synthetase
VNLITLSENLSLNLKNFIFTSESVADGHPDKVADQISDGILDAHIKLDPLSRVACETLVKNNTVILAGEISSNAEVNYDQIARKIIRDIGYTDPTCGFDADSCEIVSYISAQSHDIAVGVNEGDGLHQEQGAGDQGIMFGFACAETPELMPLPISLSHRLMEEISRQRKADKNTFLRPDAKAQVTIRYQDSIPCEVTTVVLSTQHTEDVGIKEITEYVIEQVVKKVIPHELLTSTTKYLINPTGRFVIGGPVGDCGLTGRKIIVDTYGGYSRHGGGAFSGKDPTKVDRSAAYAARNIAKNIVGAGLANKCEVQLAYAIGVAEPVSIFIDTFGTGKIDEQEIAEFIHQNFVLTPKGIIKQLDLLKPIYQATATFGHFGRTPGNDGSFSWEKKDKAKELREHFAIDQVILENHLGLSVGS